MWRYLFPDPVVRESLRRAARNEFCNIVTGTHATTSSGVGAVTSTAAVRSASTDSNPNDMNILWKLLDAIEAQQQASAAREREERDECEKTPVATTVPTTPSEDNFNDDVALLRRLFGEGGEASSKPQEETETACKREVLEDDDSYLVVIDAVGAVKEQIEITYMDRILHVEFERRRPEETKGMEVVTSTICRSGRVVQALRLNSAAPFVSPDSITASLKSGWLSIRVPKADAHLYSAPLKVIVV